MSEQNTPQNEEVDLGQLFKLIGNMFSNFFNFIGNIFKGAFHLFILVLVHFYRGLKWYIAAVVIGVIVGYILDKNTEPAYVGNLYIETNFGSSRQVYENINNLNQLAEVDQDSVELAKILGLTVAESATIHGFTVEADVDENTMVRSFSQYKSQLDSVSLLDVSYDRYVESLAFYNFVIHKVSVVSSDKFIFQKLVGDFSQEISTNTNIKRKREILIENWNREIATLDKQIREIDSLANQYLKIRIAESEKEALPNTGSSLFLGGTEQKSDLIDESKLLQQKYSLEAKKRGILEALSDNDSPVNVIADFPSSGYESSEWYTKMKLVLPIVFFALTFFGSLAYLLLGYLKEQDALLKEKQDK